MKTMTTHEKLETISKRLNSQPSTLKNFNWISNKDERDFFPSQIGISKKEFTDILSISGYHGRIKRDLVKKRLDILIERYKTK